MLSAIAICASACTSEEPEEIEPVVVLDLDTHSLAGLRLGGKHELFSVKELSRYGITPRLSSDPDERTYDCDRRSFQIECTTDTVLWFQVRWNDPWAGWEGGVPVSHEPFQGRVLHRGEPIDLNAQTTEAWFLDRFGEPYWRDVDEKGEVILFYLFGSIEWQVEFSPRGTLRTIGGNTEPLMLDPEQRRAYRVTKALSE